jgi:SNF2 family DNA or RNA helicase
VSGTPIENSPRELLSLLGFLVPKLFDMGQAAEAERCEKRGKFKPRRAEIAG